MEPKADKTINELNTIDSLSEADTIPIWDDSVGGGNTKKFPLGMLLDSIFEISKSENSSYIKFPNGLLIQWGYDAGGTASKLVNFPIPFKIGTIPSISTSLYNLSTDGNKKIWTASYNITNEGFNCSILYENNSGYVQTDGKRPFTWFAIGWSK